MRKTLLIATLLFLTAFPSFAKTGIIHIVSSVPGIIIELDGNKYKKDIYTKNVYPGTHIVRAFYPDENIPFFDTIANVKENETTSVLIKKDASATELKPVESKPQESTDSSTSDIAIGFKVDAKSASYLASVSGLSTTSTADPMLGLGVAIRKPLDNELSLLFEALFNTGSGFTNSLGSKTNLQVYPIEVNLQKDFGGWHLGGGVNYSLWNMSASGTTFSMQNGLGIQFYGGWNSLLTKNSGLEIKYTYMSASSSQSGLTINTALGTLSVGTKIWLD